MPAVAVLDTNVVVLLVSEPDPNPQIAQKQQAARFCIEELTKEGCVFVLPAPVIAELGRGSSTPRDAIRAVRKHIGKMRIFSLTKDSAEIANDMVRPLLSSRAPGDARGAVKFDTLIAAIAHEMKAKYLVTDNVRDYRKPLAVVNSTVEVIDITAPRSQGQGNIFQLPVGLIKTGCRCPGSPHPPGCSSGFP